MKILYVGCPIRVVSSEHRLMSSGYRIADDSKFNPTGKTGVITGKNVYPSPTPPWQVRLDGLPSNFYAESWELEPIVPEGLLSEVMAEEKENESVPEKVP